MADEKQEKMKNKVINIFQKHRRGDHFHFEVEEGGELIISPDGFNYVSFKSEFGQESEEEETHFDLAFKKYYLIKMVEQHKENSRINNYYVPGERLEEFLLSLPHRPGKILEIEKVIPDTMA